jgi:hypothetical protein
VSDPRAELGRRLAQLLAAALLRAIREEELQVRPAAPDGHTTEAPRERSA